MLGSCKEVVTLYAVVALLLRWGVSLHSYSGQNTPPMFGDYEAQRHWMEITHKLRVEEWYQNSTNNDLLYWGLDYPPLSAYHSLICGIVAHRINPDFVSLHSSRGHESYYHKLFMRSSVIVADILIFIPAILWWCLEIRRYGARWSKLNIGFPQAAFILTYPGLILIDHGHFQYNSISIGLMVAALAAFLRKSNVIGSVLFTMAVNYKQMELYHALPFFFYLLGICLKEERVMDKLKTLIKIGFSVLLTFFFIWLPLFNADSVIPAITRLFPLNRGPYEDKVANFWCSASVIYKFHRAWGNVGMARACLAVTAIMVLPSCLNLFKYPSMKRLHLALVNSSLAFFLFSYHVHEKSILLVAIPVALIASEGWGSNSARFLLCLWFLSVSTFSMVPLLARDGLTVPTIALSILHPLLSTLIISGFQSTQKYSSLWMSMHSSRKFQGAVILSFIGCTVLTLAYLTLPPPPRYPDLFPLLISMFSCAHFLPFFVYFNYLQLTLPK
ncbi:hypothetical protein J437_LFUL008663 [Ladona fulva]|uniref:Alpha-1,3-glucosyltransferase n=1 Tax=Ladona fulva TaxID=123851 RepID=A0A8K0NXA3_LADFU|nr:hypothetical protein J437_LFUL008663 [Ladona fulva]